LSAAYPTRAAYRAAWQQAFDGEPAVPLNLDVELASACNARCSFCLYGDRDWTEGMAKDDWDGKPKRRFMPAEMALKLIDEAAAFGIPALKTNFRGESTIHPQYSAIMQYAAMKRANDQHGGSCRCVKLPAFHDILVNTNGNCPDGAIAGLMSATKVMVSLDSMDPAVYPKVRVGLKLERALEVIDELVRRKHPDLWVRRVVCQDNKDEPFAASAKTRWPAGVRISEHYAFDRNHYKNEAVHGEDVSKWPRKYCGYPSQRIVVEASGRYSACCIAWEGEMSGGRYPETSLKDYWTGKWRNEAAAALRKGEFPSDKCKNCTSYMAYDRPERAFVQDVEVKG
jgi:molybdenum cofactor biosynthesis enzyme MoaA